MSSPAFANSGSVACRAPVVAVVATVTAENPPGNSNPEYIRINTPTGFTTCPCGGAPQYQFSFRIGSNSSGWISANSYSINTTTSQTVAAGIRVTCRGNGTTPAVICLYSATLTAVIGGNNTTNTYVLTINQASPPSGLPSC